MVCQHKILWSFRSTEAALLAGAASAASSLRWAPRTESSRPEPNLQAGCTAVFGGPHEMARRGLRLESPWTWDDARKIDDEHDTPLADARSARDRARHRKSVVEGKSVTVLVDLGGGRILKKKKQKKQ